MNKSTHYWKDSLLWMRQTIAPLFLILACPPAVLLFWFTNISLDGSFVKLGELINKEGLFTIIYEVWVPYFFGSAIAWKMLGYFSIFQLLLIRFLPGKTFYGPVTPTGNIPIYRANGPLAYGVTLATFCLCTYYFELFSPTIIYDHFPALIGALSLSSLLFCFFLLFKGLWAPSSSDSGSSGNFIFDYYWGTELYPRIFGWDVKLFTNCRFGLMSWPLILLSLASKQQQLYGLTDSMVVSVALQLIYITKFFFWETGYLRSLDIMHDRAGFYICWGCLVWVPGIYTSQAFYLVNHPITLNLFWASAIFISGASFILINFWADQQRQRVRETNGQCLIWYKKPDVTIAHYKTTTGEQKQNLLLTSGWWGLARHFHYIPEILGALCWSLPALFTHFLPYFYVVFLTILLIERAYRDDRRCAKKYGSDWLVYCQKVPYKIIPFVI